MPHVGPGVEEALVGIFLEVLFYGAFCVVAFECVQALRQRAQSSKPHWYMTFTFGALFVLITTRTIVDLKRTVFSFTNPSDAGAIDLGAPRSVRQFPFSPSGSSTARSVFVVWRSNFLIIVVPILLCLGTTGGGVYVVWALYMADISNGLGSFARINQAFSIFLYFTLSANGLCTLLIAGRIMWIRRTSSGARARNGDAVSQILTLIVESAAIYSAVLIAELVSIAYNSPTSFTFINLIGPLVGIVFSYIIIRAARNTHPVDSSGYHNTSRTGGGTQSISNHNFQSSRPQQHFRSTSRAHEANSRREPVQIQLETIKHNNAFDSDVEAAIGPGRKF
ncbi:hypothetical protein EXIGLDRAFT_754592 [Exidia glandulosa HHB12029]|uniref:Uncharacterized protein n=1 Tax=Exidia glandulosa HHB12029 TaxID=1314781 RepID=A0A165ZIX8_EXIGL|nr:hypothetical protein EXIGLDRAFT_754592 [Exidia glandulosa HHB12029]